MIHNGKSRIRNTLFDSSPGFNCKHVLLIFVARTENFGKEIKKTIK